MKIIDGTDAVLGRISAIAAKEALKGQEVNIINCQDVIITGRKRLVHEEFQEKRSRVGDSQKGPIHPRKSDRIVKRAVRGMLPNHRLGRGREAYKRVKCFRGIPEELKNQETEKIEEKNKKPGRRYTKLKELEK